MVLKEETGVPKADTTVDTNKKQECKSVADGGIKKSTLNQCASGRKYEGFIAMFFILKATICKKKNFKVGVEIGQAQKFDDLLFMYEKEIGNFCRCLQAKHTTTQKKKIDSMNLLTLEQSDFSIIKYFFSFKDLIGDNYFDGITLEDLIVYTNYQLNVSSIIGNKMKTTDSWKHFETEKSNDMFKNLDQLLDIIKDEDHILDVDKKSLQRCKPDDKSVIVDKVEPQGFESTDKIAENSKNKSVNEKPDEPIRFKLNEKSVYLWKSKANEYNINRLARGLIDWLLGKKNFNEVEHIMKPYWKFLIQNVLNIEEKKFHSSFQNVLLLDNKKSGNKSVTKEIYLFKEKLQKEIDVKNKNSQKTGKNDKSTKEINKEDNKKIEDKAPKIEITNLSEMMSGINDYPTWPVDDSVECEFNNVIQSKEIEDFMNLFVLAVSQPSVTELPEIIKGLILKDQEKKYGGDLFYSKDDIHRYVEEIFDYCHDKVFKWTDVEVDRNKKNKDGKETYMTDKDGKTFLENNWKEVKFNVKQPVKSFLERDKEIEALHKKIQRGTTVNSQTYVICGNSGIGKTEFVRKYIERHSRRFENRIIWIDGQSLDSIENSFLKLSEELGISAITSDNKKKEMNNIVIEVYRKFHGKKCLFVFDGATKQKEIDPFMPKQTNDANIPFVIITSSQSEWLGVKKIELKPIPDEKVSKLIDSKICTAEFVEIKNAEQLTNFLKYILFAVQLGSVYIVKEFMNDSNFRIAECMVRFTENQKQMEEFNLPASIGTHVQVTMMIYKSIIDSMTKSRGKGLKALEILRIMSFMAPDNINLTWFPEQSIQEKGEIFQLLEDYSIVDLNHGKISIDNSIQTITRFELKKQNIEEVYIDKTLKIFTDVYQKGGSTYDISTLREITPHLEAYSSHLDTIRQSSSKEEQTDYLEESLWMLSESYRELKDSKKMLKTINRLKPITSKKYGEESIASAVINMDLGIIASDEGKWNESKQYFKKALNICSTKCDDKNVFLVDIQMKLGDTETNLGNIEKSQIYYANALNICLDNCDDKADLVFVDIEVKLGETKAKMGNLNESKAHFEKALDLCLLNCEEENIKAAYIEVKLGDVKTNLGNYNESKSHYETALKIYTNNYKEENMDTANIEMKLGDIEANMGNFENSNIHYNKALAVYMNNSDETKLSTADIEVKLGDVKSNLKNYDESKLHFEKALNVYLENYGEKHIVNIANTEVKLGDVKINLGNYEDSKLHFENALSVYTNCFREQKLNIANIQVKLGDVEENLGNYEKSKPHFKEALDVYLTKYGDNNLNTANTQIKLGDLETHLKNYCESKAYYSEGLKVYMDHYGDSHLNTANTLFKLGSVEIDLEQYDDSKLHLEKALNVFKTSEKHSEENLSIATIQMKLGYVGIHLLKYNESKAYYSDALAECIKHYGDKSEETISVCIYLGNAQYYTSDFEKSKTYQEKALVIRQAIYGEHDIRTADSYLNLGVIEFQLNNIEAAKSYYNKAFSIYLKEKDHVKTKMIEDYLSKITE
ncbi:uncharacterized protein LOC143918632 [Arctopsyche grandis]|uniref:uncharacterized protein LOC143918632 n=1 Tax=Arctopsyche grandis TaxID=121162 RepID=UPI00406D9981